MTTDWRALCAELVKELDDLRESSEGVAGFHRNGDLAPWSELGESGEFPWLSSFDRARAALAQPEPEGPTDEQLNDIADETPWHGSPRQFGREVARAILARWGRPAAAPMNNPYRAMCSELVEQVQRAINNHGLCLEASDALMHRARALLAEPEAEGPTDEELNDIADETPWRGSPRHFGREVARAAIARWGRPAAAPVPVLPDDALIIEPAEHTLLVPVAQPVPVSERLPGPEDCDAEGRCWLGGRVIGSETPTWLLGYPAWAERFPNVHPFWLPANALPLPAPEGREVQP